MASDFAEAHADTDYHFLVGGGNLWGFTYLYSMCILEEMQWLRTTRVHSAEFFHGSLELLEEDTSVIVFQGEDETRALTDRVERFVKKVSKNVTVFDTKDYPLEGFSTEFRGLLAPIVLDTVMGRVSKHLERVRNHSLTCAATTASSSTDPVLFHPFVRMPRLGLVSSGASGPSPRRLRPCAYSDSATTSSTASSTGDSIIPAAIA